MKTIPGTPDNTRGFYGTALIDFDQKNNEAVKNILQPIEKFVNISKSPIHISCRYLGYHDEVGEDDVNKIKPILKTNYDKYLPINCRVDSLFGGWTNFPDNKRKLIMANIDMPEILNLHQDLLKATPDFDIFTSIEGENFIAHLTLAELKPEFAEHIPQEVTSFIKQFSCNISLNFSKACIWTKNGPEVI